MTGSRRRSFGGGGLAALALLALAASASGQAVVLFEHSGDSDPTSEGWDLTEGSNTTFSPVVNDLGSGFDAWAIDDDGDLLDDLGFYSQTPTAGDLAQATSNGWRVSTRLRVVDIPDANSAGSPMVSVRDGTTAYQIHFGSEVDGDPVVRLVTQVTPVAGPTYALAGAGGGYHLYELVYDPVAGSADLFVDGVEVLSDYEGFAIVQTLVLFGAGSSVDVGQGNFNSVRFEFEADRVPMGPVGQLLLAVALVGAGFHLSSRPTKGARRLGHMFH